MCYMSQYLKSLRVHFVNIVNLQDFQGVDIDFLDILSAQYQIFEYSMCAIMASQPTPP